MKLADRFRISADFHQENGNSTNKPTWEVECGAFPPPLQLIVDGNGWVAELRALLAPATASVLITYTDSQQVVHRQQIIVHVVA